MSDNNLRIKELHELSPEQIAVCHQQGTEAPFSGKYTYSKEEGVYHCVCCGNPLFASNTKYDSGSGWPSFYAALNSDSVSLRTDLSHNMRREEVICSFCQAHLGHVFPDGPEPTGLRYCINSVALDLVKSE